MDWVYVNPFTGYVHFSNLRIYEAKSDSVYQKIDELNNEEPRGKYKKERTKVKSAI